MTFHDFFYSLSVKSRAAYAAKVGTSVGYLEKVAFGVSAPSLGMLHRMVKADKRVTLDGVHETWAARQAKRRGEAGRLAS
ncbi:MAG: hypothetical protein ACK5PF_04560 [bacterium]|jgi:hypothetical protein